MGGCDWKARGGRDEGEKRVEKWETRKRRRMRGLEMQTGTGVRAMGAGGGGGVSMMIELRRGGVEGQTRERKGEKNM